MDKATEESQISKIICQKLLVPNLAEIKTLFYKCKNVFSILPRPQNGCFCKFIALHRNETFSFSLRIRALSKKYDGVCRMQSISYLGYFGEPLYDQDILENFIIFLNSIFSKKSNSWYLIWLITGFDGSNVRTRRHGHGKILKKLPIQLSLLIRESLKSRIS